MILHLDDFSATDTYHLMTQTVIPRPIAWVLTQNEGGQSHNLAPYSYFNAISSDPPLLLLSCAPKHDGDIKDTVKNAQREERLVIHIASDAQLQAIQDTASPIDYGKSELELANLSLCDFEKTGLKRLECAPIAFACQLYKTEVIGNSPQILLFAQIDSIYIDDKAIKPNAKHLQIDAKQVSALARLGLNQFVALGDILLPK